MGRRRRDNDRDYYDDRDSREGGVSYVLATAIRWIGIIIVTLIVAYVVLSLTGTIEGIFYSPPSAPQIPSGGTVGGALIPPGVCPC